MNLLDDATTRAQALLQQNIAEADALIAQARLALEAPVDVTRAASQFICLAESRLGPLTAGLTRRHPPADLGDASQAEPSWTAAGHRIRLSRGRSFYRCV